MTVRKAATLKEVADLAGVSTATVARVLHNNGIVTDETRRRVASALEATGYQLNAVAQGLRTRRTFTLGHILHSIVPNPFYAGVALGVEQEAERHGCGVLLFNTHGEPDRERIGAETLIRRRVDAVLFTTVVRQANVEFALRAGIPIVQVERPSPVETHAVTVDNHCGSFAATEHLIALGHRRIAFVGVDPDPAAHPEPGRSVEELAKYRDVERERVAGYREALWANGIAERDELIDLKGSSYDVEHARATLRRMLALPREGRPTAVFLTCDILAAGALQEIYAHGLRVPDDLSVVGFDDTFASYLTPPLTTVELPMLEIGRSAARLAIEALRDGDGAHQPKTERLVTRLIVRASTGPAPLRRHSEPVEE